MIKHNLSPSLIARFFYHNCERYLRFHATPLQMHSKAGIPVVNQDQSPVTKALLEAGNKWEESVILNKLKKQCYKQCHNSGRRRSSSRKVASDRNKSGNIQQTKDRRCGLPAYYFSFGPVLSKISFIT